MKARIQLLVSLFVTSAILSSAQTPGLQWAHGFGSYAFEYGNSVLPDVSGNVIVAGNFSDITDFDPGPGTASFTAVGADDIFFAGYTSSGTFVFARQIACTGIARVGNLAADADGNIYITGYFSQTADFFPPSGSDTITAGGLIDGFIAKYDTNGNLLWVKTLYGTTTVYGRNIDVTSDGRVFLIGELRDFADVDPDTSAAFLASQGSTDIFLACYDSSGNYSWAFSMGDFSTDMGTSVTLGNNGLVYVTGNFSGTVDFDPGPLTSNLISSGASDGFFACYDSTGAFIFAYRIGGPGFEQVNDLALDSQGNLVVTGVYDANADFDPDTAFVTAAITGDIDIFFSKYSSSGNFLFVKGIGSTGIDEIESVDIDGDDNIYIAGTLPDSADLDPDTGTVMVNGAGAEDAFFASYDSSGNYRMSVHLASPGTDKSGALAVDASGAILFTGGFSDTLDFNTSVGIYPLQSTVNSDLFLARYNSCPQDTIIITSFTCNDYLYDGQLYTSPGDYLLPGYPSLGCDSVVHLHLEFATPDTTISITNGTLTSNAADSGMTYQWVDCNSGFLPIPGADSVSFTPATNGSYAVIMEINGCTDTSVCALLNVGLPENFRQHLQVFPNPVMDDFSIDLNGYFLPRTQIKIYDAYGQTVLTHDRYSVINNIVMGNLDALSPGVYFIEITDGQNYSVTRIVKIDSGK